MKKYIILSFLTVFILWGCQDDFLKEVPVDSLTADNYYNTESDFLIAVNSSYTSLQDLYGSKGNAFGGAYWAFSEMRSDNTTYQYNTIDLSGHVYEAMDKFIMITDNDVINHCWDNSYIGISKCNSVLHYIADKKFDLKNRFIGEVKFLRALYYEHLVHYFGAVPLSTSLVQSYEDAFSYDKRTPVDSIYTQIIEDLNFAKENLPSSYPTSEFGRATEGAARTLLADVYMWQKDYTDAITELEKVQTLGYSLLPKYSDLFGINNENNNEVIFSVQYIGGTSYQGSFYMYRFLPNNSGTDLITKGQENARTGENIPTTDLLNCFETNDTRKNMIAYYTDGDGNTIPYTTKFMDPDHEVRDYTGNNFQVFRYSEVLLMLAECDFREGDEPSALSLVNQIRIRAGLSGLTSLSLDDIIQERRVEFFCEADRWDVLVRTGKAKEVMTAHGIRQKAERPVAVEADAYANIKLLFPIPDHVINSSFLVDKTLKMK
ncbi:MAG: RagB/SusD family nutrient uptake outer membrane protein [Prolixibacteraceae bacterium]|nr:RagB/SusD family nutrient uptake outer membrane protein [Prolixibacteraceae bacterium]